MIKIIADSTCDLSKEIIEKHDISILPLHIHLGDEEYKDGVNIGSEEIYSWSDENKSTPQTAAPSITDVMGVFKKHIDAGDEIIAFSISDDMSTSGNIMRLVSKELESEDLIHVINSANLSTGIGLLVLEAAIMAEEGKSVKEVVDHIEQLKPRVSASFVVDTLTYLHRGGRCNGVARLAGGVLKLHPSIVVENGKMGVGKKYRGKMSSVIMSYVKDMEDDLKHAKTDRIFITHSGCEQNIIDQVYDYLSELNTFNEILITQAGGVISSHCGPGTLGVLFISSSNKS